LVPAIAVGGVLRTNDPFISQSFARKNGSNGDVYAVALKVTVIGGVLPVLLSPGLRETNAEVYGDGGNSTTWKARVFGALGIPLPIAKTLVVSPTVRDRRSRYGLFAIEGSLSQPKQPPIVPICDYVVGWLGAIALRRRAVEGGGYRVVVSLTRTVLWQLALGIFDRRYAQAAAGSSPEHTYVAPDLFTAETPLGTYQGITEQVVMSRTPGSFRAVLLPRGSSKPGWLARQARAFRETRKPWKPNPWPSRTSVGPPDLGSQTGRVLVGVNEPHPQLSVLFQQRRLLVAHIQRSG
jgi:hypothetical protein